MRKTFLDTIYEAKMARVTDAKRRRDSSSLRSSARTVRSASEPNRLRKALEGDGPSIIAEIKRASPSKGLIRSAADVGKLAKAYTAGGASAISVLTEEDFFQGSLHDLKMVRAASALPVLRKDFIFDAFQIYEAAEAGADAVLLIVAMLKDEDLAELRSVAEDELGIDALVEVHNMEELQRVSEVGAKLIGVNNRDLHSFAVSLDVSRTLIKHTPENAIMIAESGISTREEINELVALGFDGFLIGETLMRSSDPESDLRLLLSDRSAEGRI